LRHAKIEVLENDAVRVAKNGDAFWVAGLGDQLRTRSARGASRASTILPEPWPW